jgi:ribosomal protein L16/L10AE
LHHFQFKVMMSVRAKEAHKEHVIDALRRAKFKFPGRQRIGISKKWGFTPMWVKIQKVLNGV